jgi:tRNA(Arg) A34 adenosine deaminase TadA
MCFSVANWAGISKIIYGYEKTEDMVDKKYYEGTTDIEKVNKQNNYQIEIIHISDFENEIAKNIDSWEKANL